MASGKKSERWQTAIDKGLRLGRRIDEIEAMAISGDHKAIMVEQLADEWVELFAEYPDVFPDPPISVETLREHAQQLKDASAATRKAEAEHQEAKKQVADAQRALDATINQIAAPRRTPDKPS